MRQLSPLWEFFDAILVDAKSTERAYFTGIF